MISNNKHRATGYTSPKDYFDGFEKNLLNKLPEAVNTNKDTGYKVPNDYFDAFEKKLIQTIEKPKRTKVISLFNKKTLYYASSVAAVIMLCLFIIKPTPTNLISFENLEYVSIEDYINNENITISNSEIAELYEIEKVDLDNISFLNTEDDTIINYLFEETSADNYYESEL
jgi:hypothetical protein